jgi:hypothetical protein
LFEKEFRYHPQENDIKIDTINHTAVIIFPYLKAVFFPIEVKEKPGQDQKKHPY